MINEGLKNRLLIVLAVLAVVFFFGTLSSCNNALRQKAARDKELAARLVLEEKTSKYAQERAALEEKAKAKDSQVEELKASLEAAQKALAQEQLAGVSLQEELQKATKLKETSEEAPTQAPADEKNIKK